MRALLSLIVLMLGNVLLAGPSGHFAQSGRILTLEQWHWSEGIVWAVQERQIVIYRAFDYVSRRDELIAIKPISVVQMKAIRDAIQQLPSDSIGFHHDAGLSTGAPMMRLGFSNDGSLDFGGLEVRGYFPGWLEPLTTLISSLSQPESSITYPQVISEYRQRIHADSYAPPVSKMKMRKYYGQPKPWWKFWGS